VGIVSGNYFSMLGLNPAAGRLISPGDDTTASPLAVVLGHAYWVRRFGADTSVVGREVRVDRQLATIVGVAPGGFEGTFKLARMDAYLALASMVEPSRLANRDALSVRVLGRLRPDASLREAQAAVDTIAGRLEQQYASTNNGRRVRVFSQRLAATGPQNADQFPILILFLMLLVSGVLLIAGKNVLGLLLACASSAARDGRTCRARGEPVATRACVSGGSAAHRYRRYGRRWAGRFNSRPATGYHGLDPRVPDLPERCR